MTMVVKRQIVELNKHYRVSIAEWNPHDISLQLQYNMYPSLYPHWDKFEVVNDIEVSNYMQVYGWIEEMIKEYEIE